MIFVLSIIVLLIKRFVGKVRAHEVRSVASLLAGTALLHITSSFSGVSKGGYMFLIPFGTFSLTQSPRNHINLFPRIGPGRERRCPACVLTPENELDHWKTNWITGKPTWSGICRVGRWMRSVVNRL